MKIKFFLFFLAGSAGCFAAAAKAPRPFSFNKTKAAEIKKQGAGLLSERAGSYILRAEDLASAKQYDKAIELLEYHYKKETLGKAAKAQFAFRLGGLYRQNNNYKKSLSYFKEALDSKALPYRDHLEVIYNKAQTHIEQDQYDKALEALKLWFSINEKPRPQAFILLARCYFAKERLEEALKHVEQAVSLIPKPAESWLAFAAAIYLKRANYKKARPVLERLTALYPYKGSHWKQLAGVYLHLDQSSLAFVTLDMADRMGHLKTKSDYLNLSSLYIEQGLPYQGAKLLKKKINESLIPREQKNLELLAEAFWAAREGESSLRWFKEASKTADKASFFIQYGQRLLDQERWSEAESIFKKALNTKEIEQTLENIKNYKKLLAASAKERSLFSKNILEKASQFSGERMKLGQKDSALAAVKPAEKPAAAALPPAPPTNRLESLYLGIGIALYQKKKYEEALLYFRKSIETDENFLNGYQWIDYTESAMAEAKKRKLMQKEIKEGFKI